MMARNSLHHDLPHIKKSNNSTFVMGQNRTLKIDQLPVNSKRFDNWVCSPYDEVNLTKILGEMDNGIDGAENSGEARARIVGFHETLSNEIESKAMNIHLKTISNQFKEAINNNNNSTTSIDSNSRLQKEKHESEGETSVSD